jgi:hypothetical protein
MGMDLGLGPNITKNTFMKKIIFIFAFIMSATVAMYAQALQKTIKLKQEEVPVSVVTAFEKDFASISGELTNGQWAVLTQQIDNKVVKPVYYIYKAKKGDTKFEAHYSPSGNLESTKGASKDGSSGTNE